MLEGWVQGAAYMHVGSAYHNLFLPQGKVWHYWADRILLRANWTSSIRKISINAVLNCHHFYFKLLICRNYTSCLWMTSLPSRVSFCLFPCINLFTECTSCFQGGELWSMKAEATIKVIVFKGDKDATLSAMQKYSQRHTIICTSTNCHTKWLTKVTERSKWNFWLGPLFKWTLK